MDIRNILNATDHTLLRPTATWAEIEVLIDEAADFGCASVCIPPSFVYEAVEYADGKIPVCTVVGFPNGYSTTGAKLFETEDALESGAEEIDMVINLGWVKDGLWDFIEDEIMQIRDLCEDAILKVIVETSELTDQEKIHLCQIVTHPDARRRGENDGPGRDATRGLKHRETCKATFRRRVNLSQKNLAFGLNESLQAGREPSVVPSLPEG